MNIPEILSPENVSSQADVTSKKRALELLSHMLASHTEQISSADVFDSLLAREKLSSTGLGKGVALPHGRVKNIDQTRCALLQLRKGIDFDANDDQPVDLLCALMVPEHSTDEHLQVLAALAEMFRDQNLCERLRTAPTSDKLYQELTHWRPPGHASEDKH